MLAVGQRGEGGLGPAEQVQVTPYWFQSRWHQGQLLSPLSISPCPPNPVLSDSPTSHPAWILHLATMNSEDITIPHELYLVFQDQTQ